MFPTGTERSYLSSLHGIRRPGGAFHPRTVHAAAAAVAAAAASPLPVPALVWAARVAGGIRPEIITAASVADAIRRVGISPVANSILAASSPTSFLLPPSRW